MSGRQARTNEQVNQQDSSQPTGQQTLLRTDRNRRRRGRIPNRGTRRRQERRYRCWRLRWQQIVEVPKEHVPPQARLEQIGKSIQRVGVYDNGSANPWFLLGIQQGEVPFASGAVAADCGVVGLDHVKNEGIVAVVNTVEGAKHCCGVRTAVRIRFDRDHVVIALLEASVPCSKTWTWH
jgi:hypothetical protein